VVMVVMVVRARLEKVFRDEWVLQIAAPRPKESF
jgi:hypothetical protein